MYGRGHALLLCHIVPQPCFNVVCDHTVCLACSNAATHSSHICRLRAVRRSTLVSLCILWTWEALRQQAANLQAMSVTAAWQRVQQAHGSEWLIGMLWCTSFSWASHTVLCCEPHAGAVLACVPHHATTVVL